MTESPKRTVSVVIPAKNEERTLGALVTGVRQTLPDAEVLVVDDGSTDRTGQVAAASGAQVIRHPVSRGNGAAVKAGVRRAQGDILVFMDADGQHDPADLPRLLAQIDAGYDLVVGARNSGMHASSFRRVANAVYNTLASWITGVKIADLTSGFRVARASAFRGFLHLLPNGFSYPTTSTMAFLRAGYSVGFLPITAASRQRGTKSHIRLFRDGGRFLLIIFRIGTLYSPLKIFVPISGLFFLTGLGYYAYTYMTMGRFTNLGALFFGTSAIIFMVGLLSEQITHLLYSQQKSG